MTVFREENGQPIGFEATTDAAGRFQFFDLGARRVEGELVEPPGYYPFRTTEGIAAGEALDVTYYVERGSYNPFDVTVTATRPRKEVSRTVLSAKEIDKVPGTAGDPLARRAELRRRRAHADHAGSSSCAARRPRTRACSSTAPRCRSSITSAACAACSRSACSTRSSSTRATSRPITAAPRAASSTSSSRSCSPRRSAATPTSACSTPACTSRSRSATRAASRWPAGAATSTGCINAAVPDDADVNLVTAPRYYDYQVLANYRPAPAHDLRAIFFGSDDRLEILFKNPAAVDIDFSGNGFSSTTKFYRSLLTYKFIPSERFENSLRVSAGRDQVTFGAGNLGFKLDLLSSQLRDAARFKFGEKFALMFGTDLLLARADVFVNLPPPPKEGEPPSMGDLSQTMTTNIKGKLFLSPAGFAEAELKPVSGLTLLPGVRFDYFSRISEAIVQPRLTAALAARRALQRQGGRGPLRAGARLRRDRRRVRQPEAEGGEGAALLGGRRVQAAPAHHPRRHRLLQGHVEPGQPHRHAGDRRRRQPAPAHLRQRRQGARLRARAGRAARVRQQVHRLAGLYPVALGAAGLDRQHVSPVRLRPAAHPHARSAATCCRATGRSAAASAWSAATPTRRSPAGSSTPAPIATTPPSAR